MVYTEVTVISGLRVIVSLFLSISKQTCYKPLLSDGKKDKYIDTHIASQTNWIRIGDEVDL